MICTLWNREEIEADLVGTDALTDIAVLKLKGDPDRKFKAVAFGDSSAIRVGDSVLAMGSRCAVSIRYARDHQQYRDDYARFYGAFGNSAWTAKTWARCPVDRA